MTQYTQTWCHLLRDDTVLAVAKAVDGFAALFDLITAVALTALTTSTCSS